MWQQKNLTVKVLRQFPKALTFADATTGIQYCLVGIGEGQRASRCFRWFVKDNPTSTSWRRTSAKKSMLFSIKKIFRCCNRVPRSLKSIQTQNFLQRAICFSKVLPRAGAIAMRRSLAFERASNVPNAAKSNCESIRSGWITTHKQKSDKAIITLRIFRQKVKDPEIIAKQVANRRDIAITWKECRYMRNRTGDERLWRLACRRSADSRGANVFRIA